MATRNIQFEVNPKATSVQPEVNRARFVKPKVHFPTKIGVLEWAVNAFAALLILMFLSPVFLAISVIILLGSGRPVFYRQTRVGRGGKTFSIFKFRTMINGAERLKSDLLHLNMMTGPFFKLKDDPRLTREGKYLRKWSLDELPQLFNVLRGEMVLVGPRPMLPSEVEELACEDILVVRPGLTGLWQVSGRNEVFDAKKKLWMDRSYIRKKSFWFDLKILLLTFRAVIGGRGAY